MTQSSPFRPPLQQAGAGPLVALIGFGAIGAVVAERLQADPALGRLCGVLVRPRNLAEARAALPESIAIETSLGGVLAHRPGLVIECAGQGAVREYGAAILDAGIELVIVSSGALAEPDTEATLHAAATRGMARLTVAPGAIAGLDGLGALKQAGLRAVTYTSTKPPLAWRGTPAEQAVALETLACATVFFEGSAREAALAYPKNANLAATVALAGLGFERTRVRLVADPAATGNQGMIEAESAAGSLRVVMSGAASANPKTSASTAFSLLHLLARRAALVAV